MQNLCNGCHTAERPFRQVRTIDVLLLKVSPRKFPASLVLAGKNSQLMKVPNLVVSLLKYTTPPKIKKFNNNLSLKRA